VAHRAHVDAAVHLQNGHLLHQSGNNQGTFREHSGNFQGTFREPSANQLTNPDLRTNSEPFVYTYNSIIK
jgi:hypothetical protein